MKSRLEFVTIIHHCRRGRNCTVKPQFSLVFWLLQITAFVLVTNIAEIISKKALSISSSNCDAHLQFIATISHTEPAPQHGHCLEIVRVTKTLIIRAGIIMGSCCLHSLSVLFPLFLWAGALTILPRLVAHSRLILAFMYVSISVKH